MTEVLDKATELVAEQAYFDRAYDRREIARHKAKEGGPAGGRYAQIALNRQNRDYLAQLAPNDVAVAHGAIQLDDGEVLYVGRNTIWDEDQEVLVINWRTQLGELFERATVQNPLGVTRKRTFQTRGTTIENFDDAVFADLLSRVEELTDLELSGVDDALLQDLNSNRNGSMRDIVRTIQAAQSHLIRHDPNVLLVVQGGPGTGKSAVALHRASWLLFNQSGLTPDKVLVVGPNDTFTNYIKNVLPALGDVDVPHRCLRRLGPQGSTLRPEPSETARLKGEARMARLLSRALRQRVRFAGSDEVLSIGTGASATTVGRAAVERQMELLREAPTYNAGRQRMRGWLTAQVESANARPFGAKPVDSNAIDIALDRVWPPLTAQQFVRDLLGSRNRLLEAGGDDFTTGDIQRLYRTAAPTAAGERWSDSDVALLDEAETLINGMPDRYAHLIVDEAQDLSPMQLRSIARRSTNGAMTVVGDIAQSTGAWARDTWDDVVTGLQRDGVPVVQEELAYGYRVPSEIYAVAAKLLPYVAPGLAPLTVVRAAPEEPHWARDDGDLDLTDETLEAIEKHAAKGRCVAVIATPADKPRLAEELRSHGISFADADSGALGSSVNLVSAAESKGLEFDAVVVVEPAAIAAMDRGIRQLYIALTRATRYLTVVYSQAFEPLGLTGVEPIAPIDASIGVPAPPTAAMTQQAIAPRPTSAAPLSPPMISAATALADQIRDEVVPHKYADYLAEVARQLGLPS